MSSFQVLRASVNIASCLISHLKKKNRDHLELSDFFHSIVIVIQQFKKKLSSKGMHLKGQKNFLS